MRRLLPLFFALATVGAVIGYRTASPGIGEKFLGWFVVEDEIPVRAVQVRRVPIALEVHGTGELRPVKEADIVSTIPGVLAEMRYQVGDAVSAGQVVASLRITELVQRSGQTEAALKAAQVDLREKEIRLNDLEKALERTRELRARDLIAAQDVSAAETAAATARAQMELARAQVAQQQASLEQLRYFLSFSKLVAPFSGVVTRRMSEPGTYLRQSEPVVTVGSLDAMRVMSKIPENDLNRVQRGMPARIAVEAFPGRVFEGHVIAMHSGSEAGDSGTGAEILVTNPEHLLKPNMRASVLLLTGEKRNVLLVPRQAVTEIAGKSHVDVVLNGRVQRKAITVGQDQETTVEVVGGVREGDWVVVDSRQPLIANSRVRIAAEKTNPP